MKRQIKFRGQRIDNKEWVYGCYFITPLTDENPGLPPETGWYFLTGDIRHCISTNMGQSGVTYVVIPETVGQFTGLLDKNGVEIYENDILQMYKHDDYTHKHEKAKVWEDEVRGYQNDIREVKFYRGTFYTHGMCSIAITFMHMANPGESYDVIGNIFNNPELLKP